MNLIHWYRNFKFQTVRKIRIYFRDVNDWRIKFAVYEFLNKNGCAPVFAIHGIRVQTKSHIVRVAITTGRPGILIGKRGTHLDALIAYLTTVVRMPVEVSIVEHDPWR